LRPGARAERFEEVGSVEETLAGVASPAPTPDGLVGEGFEGVVHGGRKSARAARGFASVRSS
jgi:hypothetical protein